MESRSDRIFMVRLKKQERPVVGKEQQGQSDADNGDKKKWVRRSARLRGGATAGKMQGTASCGRSRLPCFVMETFWTPRARDAALLNLRASPLSHPWLPGCLTTVYRKSFFISGRKIMGGSY